MILLQKHFGSNHKKKVLRTCTYIHNNEKQQAIRTEAQLQPKLVCKMCHVIYTIGLTRFSGHVQTTETQHLTDLQGSAKQNLRQTP